MVATHALSDLAISGDGFFVVRSGDRLLYTRDGQFSIDGDGRLVTADGWVLQASGGDAVLDGPSARIDEDGSIHTAETSSGTAANAFSGVPLAKLTIVDFADHDALTPQGNGRYAAPADAARELDSPRVEQGMIEASNTSTATEMLTIMAALRSAESGQRIVQLYDELLAQAGASFGQGQT